VVTAGPIFKKPHATIVEGWMDEGAFASLVDYDSYWHPKAMAETAKFCTDDVDQLHYYKDAGFFQGIPEIHGDLGELVTGTKQGRESEAERTMTANLGLALEDMAVAPLIYRKALELGIGTTLEL
jgi:ornithine cyclodeaminase/alanine dehydrogenase-like protein (mu-crystallin family)